MSISIEELRQLAENLYFEMSEEQYKTLQAEFDIILKQMNLIGKIENVDNIEPLVFPVESLTMGMRDDNPTDSLSPEEVLKNAHANMMGMVKVQKVVG